MTAFRLNLPLAAALLAATVSAASAQTFPGPAMTALRTAGQNPLWANGA